MIMVRNTNGRHGVFVIIICLFIYLLFQNATYSFMSLQGTIITLNVNSILSQITPIYFIGTLQRTHNQEHFNRQNVNWLGMSILSKYS